jgi:hypothetical protein
MVRVSVTVSPTSRVVVGVLVNDKLQQKRIDQNRERKRERERERREERRRDTITHSLAHSLILSHSLTRQDQHTVFAMNLERFALQLKNGVINGNDLKGKVERNELSKGDRRKIMKLSQQLTARENLSARQQLRLQVKEKKKLPKLTKDDRRLKFQKDLEREREAEQANFTICLGCRKRGHFVKDCPKRQLAEVQHDICCQICFNCGGYDHTLKNCPAPRDRAGNLPFAKCFICKQPGHISRDCPENANGLYPNGGCCHICFQKSHLAKDCPDKKLELPGEAAQAEAEAEAEAILAREDGVRVKGISSTDARTSGGDDVIIDDGEFAADHDEEDDSEQEAKKSKKSKKSKKRKHD